MSAPAPPPLLRTLLCLALRLALLGAVAWGVHLLLGVAMESIADLPPGTQGLARNGLILLMLVLYAVLIAVPFVPGIEIGVMLMVLRGAEIAPAVYAATLGGLLLAFLAGRLLPYPVLHRLCLDLRLAGAARLVETVAPLSEAQRLALLRRALPRRLGGVATRWRYLTIAALVNVPGNGVIGGGGGICLIAGLSGLFSARAITLTLALAVAPVPLAVWLYGPGLVAP